jgi:hypothetical protein
MYSYNGPTYEKTLTWRIISLRGWGEVRYHTVGTVTQASRQIVETDKIDNPDKHIHMTSHFPGLIQTLK